MRRRHLIIALFALLLTSSAHANIPLPWMFGFRMPSWVAYLTFGLSFVGVVIIEGLVIRAVSKIPLRESLLIALRVNTFTTLFGFLSFYGPFFFIGLIVLIAPLANWLHTQRGWKPQIAYGFAFLPPLIFYGWGVMGGVLSGMFISLGTWASLIPAFLLSVLLECWWAQKRSHQRHVLRGILLGNVSSYLALTALLFATGFNHQQVPAYDGTSLSFFSIPSAVRQGNIDLAMELADEAIAFQRGEVPWVTWFLKQVEPNPQWEDPRFQYMAYTEERIVRTFEGAGYYEEALMVVEEALNSGLLVDRDSEAFTEVRERLRAKMAEQPSP